MNPEQAFQKQLEIYRRMTGGQRVEIALNLHQLSCDVSREGIRHQHPNATPKEVEEYLKQRIIQSREWRERTRIVA
jgi:hypothetical protein